MEAIDRLGWAAALTVSAYGVTVGVRTDDPAALPSIEALLPPGARSTSDPVVSRVYSLVTGAAPARPGLRRFSILYVDALRAGRRDDVASLLPTLESDLHLHVAEWAKDRVFLHAGVVEWGGRALLLPGASHAGKSTMVAALLRAGARYYSDEFAVLDREGRVHPFPRPLGLREPGEAWPSRRVLPGELGAKIGKDPVPVGAVVLSTYQAGARWHPVRLPPALGALRMVEHAVPARRRPAAVLSALRSVVARAPVLASERGEADATAARLLALVEENAHD